MWTSFVLVENPDWRWFAMNCSRTHRLKVLITRTSCLRTKCSQMYMQLYSYSLQIHAGSRWCYIKCCVTCLHPFLGCGWSTDFQFVIIDFGWSFLFRLMTIMTKLENHNWTDEEIYKMYWERENFWNCRLPVHKEISTENLWRL